MLFGFAVVFVNGYVHCCSCFCLVDLFKVYVWMVWFVLVHL